MKEDQGLLPDRRGEGDGLHVKGDGLHVIRGPPAASGGPPNGNLPPWGGGSHAELKLDALEKLELSRVSHRR